MDRRTHRARAVARPITDHEDDGVLLVAALPGLLAVSTLMWGCLYLLGRWLLA